MKLGKALTFKLQVLGSVSFNFIPSVSEIHSNTMHFNQATRCIVSLACALKYLTNNIRWLLRDLHGIIGRVVLSVVGDEDTTDI